MSALDIFLGGSSRLAVLTAGTPTFFVDGELVELTSLDSLSTAIEEALAAATDEVDEAAPGGLRRAAVGPCSHWCAIECVCQTRAVGLSR